VNKNRYINYNYLFQHIQTTVWLQEESLSLLFLPLYCVRKKHTNFWHNVSR